MNDVLAITRRELEERRLVPVAAAAFAALALLVPFFPAVHGSTSEIIAMGSIVLGVSFTLGLAAVLGATFVGRDVVAGRMSFYFARPVSGVAIWFGKLLAAVLLIVGSCAIAMLPAIVAGISIHGMATEGSLLAFAGATAALFIAAHAGGTMIRSHSAMIGLDFLAVVAVAAAGWLIVLPLVEGGAVGALVLLAWSGAAVLLLAFAIAGAWQLANGRTDGRRGHVAFSQVFWGIIAIFVIAAAGWTAWIVTPSPSDLQTPVTVRSGGTRALVEGIAKHRFDYRPLFLLDVASGKYERVGGALRWSAELSRDGSRIVAVERNSLTSASGELYVRDARPGAPWVDLHATAGVFDVLAATGDASRIADVHQGKVVVYDTASKASLGSANVGPGTYWIYFATPDLVRMYSIGGSPRDGHRILRASELDLRTRTLRRTGELDVNGRFAGVRASDDGSRLAVLAHGGSTLCDGRTLQPIAALPPSSSALFLRDGRIVINPGRSLAVLTRDGVPLASIATAVPAYPIAEVAPGTILAVHYDRDPLRWRTLVVDVDRGVLRSEALQMPTYGAIGFSNDPRPKAASPMQLMVNPASSKLVRWNALTGEKTVVR